MVADLTNREILDLLADADPNEVRDVLVRFLRFNAKPSAPPPHCPECGTNLRNDHILELDGFFIDPRGEVRYRGKDLQFGPNQVLIFHTIAQNLGRFVRAQTIAERCCKKSRVWPVKSLHTQIKHIRDKLELFEVPDPIGSIPGISGRLGYRWKGGDFDSAPICDN